MADQYKAPKIKLKKRKAKTAPMGKESDLGEASIVEGKGKAKYADIPLPKKIKVKKKKGETVYRKSSGPSKINVIDARAMTKEDVKTGMEEYRLKKEKDLYKKILKRMKNIGR